MPKGENLPPVLYIELCDRQGSGFIQDGTAGTPHQVELDAPGIRFIPNTGFRRGKKVENGKEVRYNERIRYIKNEVIISMDEQRVLNIEPSGIATEDKIPIEKGFASVVREGSTVGLYDYLLESYYNESNPDRSERATALYRTVNVDEENETFNEAAMIAADAVKYVGSLYSKFGKGQYRYDLDKIDTICELFQVYAETPQGKIQALVVIAKRQPDLFLKRVVKFEQMAVTFVLHALQLNVIRFDKNVAVFCNKPKVVKNLGNGHMDHETKVNKLADFLRTKEGYEIYNEIKTEVDIEQEKAI